MGRCWQLGCAWPQAKLVRWKKKVCVCFHSVLPLHHQPASQALLASPGKSVIVLLNSSNNDKCDIWIDGILELCFHALSPHNISIIPKEGRKQTNKHIIMRKTEVQQIWPAWNLIEGRPMTNIEVFRSLVWGHSSMTRIQKEMGQL